MSKGINNANVTPKAQVQVQIFQSSTRSFQRI